MSVDPMQSPGAPRAVLTPLEVRATDEVMAALATLGRTEDVTFRSDGRRAVLAGFGTNRLVVLDLDLPEAEDGAVVVHGVTSLYSPWLQNPHGVTFLGDDLVAVANRVLDVVALRLPPPQVGVHEHTVDIAFRIGVGDVGRALTAGSLTALPIAPDLVELLVCNNYANCVTRHVVDLRASRCTGEEVFLDAGVSHPDGITVSANHRVVAVSVRRPSVVQLYDNQPELGAKSRPIGALHDVASSHGVCFTADDEYVLLADGAAPVVHVYRRGHRRTPDDHGWSGDHHPVASYQVMTDEVFASGPVKFDDGGAKGVCIDPSQRFVAVSAEAQPLAFFALSGFLPGREASPGGAPPALDTARAGLLRELDRVDRLGAYARGLEAELAAQDERIRLLEQWTQGLLQQRSQAPG